MTLSEVSQFIVDSEHKTAPTQETGHPSIRTPNIGRGRLLLDGVQRVSEEVYDEWTRRAVPQEGDLILAREAPVGNVGIVLEGMKVCLGQRTVLIRPDREEIDPAYLTYLLLSREVQGRFRALSTGSTVPHLNLSDLRSFSLPELPPLPVQRRIAGVLSAYDNLIANNARRIDLLEDMAQAVYREWFVEMRFPGHAEAQMRETEALGAVPAGWEIVTVPEAIEINPRISIPDGEKHYVPMAGIPENSMIVRHTEMRDTRRGRKFQNRDTLFARITPSLENGKTGYVQFMPSDGDVGVGSGELINLRSKTLCSEYVYLLARTERFRQNAIKSMTGASGRQRVQLDCFDDFRIAQPDEETLAHFERTVRPMFEMVQTLAARNETLRRTRDLLLPRLVSGEVAVGAAVPVPSP